MKQLKRDVKRLIDFYNKLLADGKEWHKDADIALIDGKLDAYRFILELME